MIGVLSVTKFTIDDSFFDIFPDAQINVMILKNINNNISENEQDEIDSVLEKAHEDAQQFLTDDVFRKNEVVAKWRDIYQQFKKKKGARSSIEALLKRVDQGKGVGSINPLVDIYNASSLTYGVPCGGEDLDTIEGDMHLGVAKGGEDFFPLGDDQNEPALEGEVIYYDDKGAVCRCLNWRDGQRTMLTEDTKNAIMVMEATDESQKESTNEAMEFLKRNLEKYMNISANIHHLDAENSSIEI